MSNEKKKKKPAYSIWQNSVYAIKHGWRYNKKLMLMLLLQIVIAVALSTITIFLPKTVVAQVTAGAAVRTLVYTLLAYTAAIMILQAGKIYLTKTSPMSIIKLRLRFYSYMILQSVNTDYANLEKQDFTDARVRAGETASGNDRATEQIYHTLVYMGTNLLGIIVYTSLLVTVDPAVLLITALTAIIGVIARQWVTRWYMKHKEETDPANKRIGYIENMGHWHEMAKDIRLFSMSGWLDDVFNVRMGEVGNFKRRHEGRNLAADAVNLLTAFLREGIAYAYLIWQVLYCGMSVDSFVLMLAAIGGFSTWISGLLGEYARLSQHSADFCILRGFLEYPSKFKYEDGEPIKPQTGMDYELELRSVSFRYDGAEENILENINLTIRPGEKLAIVGLNGAGKTTLIKLLCGFYDPTEGEVLLNGRDIRIYNRDQYYSLFTAVFQDFNILPISIAKNLCQTTLDKANLAKLQHCLELSDLKEKINALPNGLESLMLRDVNEDAVELSGGETQRLMLARALYKEAPILVLDEPTAALDPIAENKLYNRYNELSAGKTSIYISHRLASTRFCDRIILIGDKNIIEEGTHDELMARDGKYRELFDIQSKYYRDGEEVS